MRYYVYVLLSLSDRQLYVGFTTDLQKRLKVHAQGRGKTTKSGRPFRLIHYEYYVNESDARAREIFLKSGFGRRNLREALKRTLKELQ